MQVLCFKNIINWGSPNSKKNQKLCKRIEEIQIGVKTARYIDSLSPTDTALKEMFEVFEVDITNPDPGLRLFFTNYSLRYRKGSETGGMTKSIMQADKELFDDLVFAIKPKIPQLSRMEVTYRLGGLARVLTFCIRICLRDL